MHNILNLGIWGYLVIFIFSFLESVPGVGFFAPGQSAVILAGFFSSLGLFDLKTVITICAIGAILGDMTGYLVGRRYGIVLVKKYGKRLNQEYIKQTQELVRKHAGKTIIFAKFNAITRGIAPLISGYSKVDFYKYLVYNTIGSLAWSVFFVMVGYVFGQGTAGAGVGRFILLFVFLSVLVGYYFMKKRNGPQRYLLIVGLVSLVMFLILLKIAGSSTLFSVDKTVSVQVATLWSPGLTKTMILLTNIASTQGVFLIALVISGILIYRRKFSNLLMFVLGIGLGLFIELFTKSIVNRPRPVDSLVSVSNSSFPSGHAIMSMIVFSLVFYFFKEDFRRAGRIVLGCACTLVILLVDFSRIYLHAHWLTDVIGGLCAGAFAVILLQLIFKSNLGRIVDKYLSKLFYSHSKAGKDGG